MEVNGRSKELPFKTGLLCPKLINEISEWIKTFIAISQHIKSLYSALHFHLLNWNCSDMSLLFSLLYSDLSVCLYLSVCLSVCLFLVLNVIKNTGSLIYYRININICTRAFIASSHLVRTWCISNCQQHPTILWAVASLGRLSVHHLWSSAASAIKAQLSLNFKTIISELQIACCEQCSHFYA